MNIFNKTVVKEVKVVDETKVKELQQELAQVKKDFESDKRILKAEQQIEINKAVSNKEKENITLSQENAVLKEKVAILEKAFENMGFDVKDMKEILNKLVDGIVSKNTVNVIK